MWDHFYSMSQIWNRVSDLQIALHTPPPPSPPPPSPALPAFWGTGDLLVSSPLRPTKQNGVDLKAMNTICRSSCSNVGKYYRDLKQIQKQCLTLHFYVPRFVGKCALNANLLNQCVKIFIFDYKIIYIAHLLSHSWSKHLLLVMFLHQTLFFNVFMIFEFVTYDIFTWFNSSLSALQQEIW